MKLIEKAISFLLLLLFILIGLKSFAQEIAYDNQPKTLTALKSAIQKILIETKTPGAGVALVSGDETIMLEGFGKADIENNIDVNENTMFRLGSVSKVYVALAILKLQEEGRLNLKDKIRDLIPEIEFNNPWEDKFPIRIENLLEHTSGWDEWHLAELGSDDPKPKTLKEALDFYPKSRTSKFIPGTRIGYSNVGMSVATYIVEKVSGLTFEAYIDNYFFKPMGIENMTFLQSDQFKKMGVKLYDNGIKLNYLHGLYRPSLALNGSPKDMVKMIKLFINRGRVNNNQLISDSSLLRMEKSESLPLFSKYETLKRYGLANSPSNFKGFVYRGHGGSLPGGNADFAYLPEYNMGFVVMINGGDESAVQRIAGLIKYYQTKDLIQKPIDTVAHKFKISTDPSGFYTIIHPKIDQIGFIEHIKTIQKVWIKNDTLYKKFPLIGNSTAKYIPVGNNEFRSVNSKLIELALINDPLDGNILLNYGYFKKITPFRAYALITIFIAFPITLLSTTIFGLLWTLISLFGKKKNKTALWICLWPLITNSFVFVVIISSLIKVQTRYDAFQLFGTMNLLSVLFFICSICYALASVWSVYYIFRNHRVKMSRIFYFYSALAAVLNLIFMFYLSSNGLIGVPTWI
jgi:CubicO group peptidase (beta-lactamase class C family)